ncbi:hypothetical protein [Litorilituus sediminis]|uniref:Phospholipase A2 domain-containing protein n=1 Tax=Litorilituus sediminis TaxID=718192 RepID=A0A4P6P216_9GAMM|nr:hypothetical protein [Litorilituus sediminis]QBG35416.1 hypothetical protein EMK97_06630 [Litorilituus sediminis]
MQIFKLIIALLYFLPMLLLANILPEDFLIEGVSINYHEDLKRYNNSYDMDNIAICNSNSVKVELCKQLFPDGQIYLDTYKNKAYLISENFELSKIKKKSLKIFTQKLLEYIEEASFIKKKSLVSHDHNLNLLQEEIKQGQNFDIFQAADSYPSDWCSSSPEVFPGACKAHDFCYDSGVDKRACDDAFKLNMMNQVRYFKSRNPEKTLEYLLLVDLTIVYHTAVKWSQAAWDAFCAATPNPSEQVACQENARAIAIASFMNEAEKLGERFSTFTGTTFYDDGTGQGGRGEPSSKRYRFTCEVWIVLTNGIATGTYTSGCNYIILD